MELTKQPEISFKDTLKSKKKINSDEGYKEIINYLDGDIIVRVDDKDIEVKNQGLYQTIYTISSTGVHHSKMKFPNIHAETAAAENANITFYPFSIEECDMMGRLKMGKGEESHFHYHSGRTARLILSGKITMIWIQNNEFHEVELEENDWIVIPANTPYKTIVKDKVDILSNWIGVNVKGMTENKLNTIGTFRKANR